LASGGWSWIPPVVQVPNQVFSQSEVILRENGGFVGHGGEIACAIVLRVWSKIGQLQTRCGSRTPRNAVRVGAKSRRLRQKAGAEDFFRVVWLAIRGQRWTKVSIAGLRKFADSGGLNNLPEQIEIDENSRVAVPLCRRFAIRVGHNLFKAFDLCGLRVTLDGTNRKKHTSPVAQCTANTVPGV
jgi:hypothetical protein